MKKKIHYVYLYLSRRLERLIIGEKPRHTPYYAGKSRKKIRT